MAAKTAAEIWRDWKDPTLPGVDPYQPPKADIREFLAPIEALAAEGGVKPPNLGSGTFANRLNLDFEGVGDVIAIGSNSRESNFVEGLQIGGGKPSEGPDGMTLAADGHASWLGLYPSKNYSVTEVALYTSMASGGASCVQGTNRIVRSSGSPFPAEHVGRRVFFDSQIYRIASRIDANTITVTTDTGGAVVFPSAVSDVFKVCFVHGRGLCRIQGDRVLRLEGDPFVVYPSNPSFEFFVNGAELAVVEALSASEYRLASAPGNAASVPYEFFIDVDAQFSTLRLHGANEDAENLTLTARVDGYWIRSQFGGYGKYRSIRLATGEYAPGAFNQQIVLHPDGSTSLGGDYERDALRILPVGPAPTNRLDLAVGPSGFAPSLRTAGVDADIGLTIDVKGSPASAFRLTKNNFAAVLFEVGDRHIASMPLPQYADDAAAGAGGIPVNGWYQSLTIGGIRQRRA